MKKTKVLYLFGLLVSFVTVSLSASCQLAAKAQSFDWSTKLQLSPEQEQLLHLYSKLQNDSADPTKLREPKEEVERLAAKLGPLAVRPARPDELLISRVGQSGEAKIRNSSDTNLAFTVSVKGDEQWVGSRKASMGRQTYLPPKGTLTVTNLYWTTPRMAESGH